MRKRREGEQGGEQEKNEEEKRKKEGQREVRRTDNKRKSGDRGREVVSLSLVHCPNAYNGPWLGLQSGARNQIQASHVDVRNSAV